MTNKSISRRIFVSLHDKVRLVMHSQLGIKSSLQLDDIFILIINYEVDTVIDNDFKIRNIYE